MKALATIIMVLSVATTPSFADSPITSIDSFAAAHWDETLAALLKGLGGDIPATPTHSDGTTTSTDDYSWDVSYFGVSGAVSMSSASSDTRTLGSSLSWNMSFEQWMLNPITLVEGAETQHQAAVTFFEAYKAHDRSAAAKVATISAMAKLAWNSSAGDTSQLVLVDDSHISTPDGGIELTAEKNAKGQWVISDVTVTIANAPKGIQQNE